MQMLYYIVEFLHLKRRNVIKGPFCGETWASTEKNGNQNTEALHHDDADGPFKRRYHDDM